MSTKLTGLTEDTSISDDDIVYKVDDPTGSAMSRKITWANIKVNLKAFFDTLYPSGSGTSTGTNTGDNSANANSGLVHTIGDESIGGVKTLSDTLILSDAINENQSTNISSATTTDIGAATGNYALVTGVNTITGLGTIQAGVRRIITFTGVLTLTHNATSLLLPGEANITTAVNDRAEFISLGSGDWICTNYQKKDGTALVSAGGGGGVSEEFKAYQTAATSFTTSDQTIIFNVESFDTDSNYNITTGIYTVPSDGLYWFDILLVIGGSIVDQDRMILKMQKNGTDIREVSPDVSGNEDEIYFAVQEECLTGDEIKVVVRNITSSRGTSTTQKDGTSFSGYKLK